MNIPVFKVKLKGYNNVLELYDIEPEVYILQECSTDNINVKVCNKTIELQIFTTPDDTNDVYVKVSDIISIINKILKYC